MPALQSTAGGHTPIAFTALPPAVPLVTAGQLRALAVTSAKRSSALPDIPAMAEAGQSNQESENILPVLTPASPPQPIVDLLHGEIAKIVALPDMQQTLAAQGFDALATTPEEFGIAGEARARARGEGHPRRQDRAAVAPIYPFDPPLRFYSAGTGELVVEAGRERAD